jgi:4-hydroxyphenylpyruvate dioxygenase-like putative hemolysin
LSNFALNFLKKKGIEYVKFHTNWKNKKAITAFRKMGFKEKNIMFYKKLPTILLGKKIFIQMD